MNYFAFLAESVIPLENGIQVKGMGMDPGFHRGDD